MFMKRIFSKILAFSFALFIPLTAFLITTNQKKVSASTVTLSNGTSLMNIFSDCDIYFTYREDKIWFQNTSYEYTETLSGNINTHVGGSLFSNNEINNYIAKIERRVVTEPEQVIYSDFLPLCTYRTDSFTDNKVEFSLSTVHSDFLRLHFNNFFIPFGQSTDNNFYNRFYNVLYRFRMLSNANYKFNITIKYVTGFNEGTLEYETLTINDYTTNNFRLDYAVESEYNINNLTHPFTVRYGNYDFGCFDIDINVTTNNNLETFILYYTNYKDLGGWYTIDDFNNLLELYNSTLNERIYFNAITDALDTATPFEVITNTVESFLNTELFPNFKVYYFLLIAFGFALFGVVIKYAFGG